jgi:hypothetical protein
MLQTCDVWVSRRRGSAWCWMLHATWVVVLMMLQHFVSRVSSDTLTCCDICILMFHCALANVANVEFRCCRHVMLVLCQGGGGGREGSWCWMLHASRVTTWSQHSRNMVATCGGGERKTPDFWMLHVTSFATCSEHVRSTLATSFVECCKDDSSQHGKSSSQHRKSCSQHLLASQRDRRLISSLHPNRTAQDPSDASARIGRPGASNSD